MHPLTQVRSVLKQWSEKVEILPATGGATEDLLHPEAEEQEERSYTDERIFDTVFERPHEGDSVSCYGPTPPLLRTQKHLFRYFLDGSFRSHFLGTVLEGNRDSPIHYAQIGACVLHRRDDGTVQREKLQIRQMILVSQKSLSEEAWQDMEKLCDANGVTLENLMAQDILSKAYGDVDLRVKALGRVRFKMRELEAELMEQILPSLNEGCWLIVDGSLMFEPMLRALIKMGDAVPPVLGVSKSFRKDPQFVFGRGPKAQRFSIYGLLAGLPHEHRTVAFRAYKEQVAFWYVRLREQKHLDYPLMGVVKCELVTPNQEPVHTELVDLLSQALVGERSVTPHGRDRRWHAHLYPIFLAEEAIKNAFYSREVIRQAMRWR